jgi:predicted component of type VI protein secretion system
MSLLNKFIDSRTSSKPASTGTYESDAQREDIVRNLQNLLQTRRSANPQSHIGIMDFCEQSLSDALIHQLCNGIQQQIQQHEKRLCQVQVTLAECNSACWQLSVAALLVNPAGKKFNFILEFAKSAYQRSTRLANGVFV